MFDIYFEKSYGELYEDVEEGNLVVYHHESEYGKIRHMFIKRKIETEVVVGDWYDLITPYGYGGPLITKLKADKKDELVKDFNESFKEYCQANNIVSEFVRFHPILKNADNFSGMYQNSRLRQTVGTNLKKYGDPFQKEFSKSARKNVRRALRDGVTYTVSQNIEEIADFQEIYYNTMDRNKADEYYYFEESYFMQNAEKMADNILLVKALYEDKVIAMGFYYIYENTIHVHLSGTLNEYLNLSPAYILRYAVTEWGKNNGYDLIHHGGGRSDSVNDPLFRFKERFGSLRYEYVVGKKIWNHEIYEKLSKGKPLTEFFPLYRS